MAEDELNVPEDDGPISLQADDRDGLAGAPVLLPEPDEEDAEPISLVDDDESSDLSAVRTIGAVAKSLSERKTQFKRPLNFTGAGATRCKFFHSKIALAPLEHMEDVINEWLDGEQIEVKSVGHMVGVMEGKSPEPNAIVWIWY